MAKPRKKSGNDQILGPDIMGPGSMIKENMAAGKASMAGFAKNSTKGKDFGDS